MAKCLVTKLDGVVTDANIPKLGEMIFDVNVITPNSAFYIGGNEKITIKALDGGFFKNASGENIGTEVTTNGYQAVYFGKSGKYSLTPKYALKWFSGNGSALATTINVEDLQYNEESILSLIGVGNSYGDLSKVNTSNINWLNLQNSKVKYDLSKIINPNLANVYLSYNTNFINAGDVSQCAVATKVQEFSCYGMSGDISTVFLNCPQLKYIDLIPNDDGYYGDIAGLRNVITGMYFYRKCNIYGDMSKLKANYISFTVDDISSCTWIAGRDSGLPIMALRGNIDLGNYVDAMLIDQSNRSVASSYPFKTISCYGNRTSAFDSAVSALQAKGFTVEIKTL